MNRFGTRLVGATATSLLPPKAHSNENLDKIDMSLGEEPSWTELESGEGVGGTKCRGSWGEGAVGRSCRSRFAVGGTKWGRWGRGEVAGVELEARRPLGGTVRREWWAREALLAGGLEGRGVRTVLVPRGALPSWVNPALCEENSAVSQVCSVWALSGERRQWYDEAILPKESSSAARLARVRLALTVPRPTPGAVREAYRSPRQLAASDRRQSSRPRAGADPGAFVRKKIALGQGFIR